MFKTATSRPGRRLFAAGASALGAVTLGLAPAAQAASSATSPTQSAPYAISAQSSARTASATAHAAGLAGVRPNTTSCTIYPSNPLAYSGEPYGQGVEGLAQVQCTGVVYAIQVEAEIYDDNNGNYALSSWNTQYSTLQAGANAEYPRSSGYWQTCGAAYVWWTSTTYSYITGCSPQTWIS